jgi:hypothetical protein
LSTMVDTTVERDGTILLGWLRLLGWKVEIDREDGQWVGLARRVGSAGGDLRIAATAESHGALVWQLFSGALTGLERDRPLGSSLRAA